MILLISCFITHQRKINRYDRLDIFKATLFSYSKIDFSSIYLFVKLDDEFIPRRLDLLNFIKRTFVGKTVHYVDTRIESQRDWIKIFDHFRDSQEFVWFTQNDDHVFVDKDDSLIREGLNHLANDSSQFKSIYYSHWPEILRLSGKLGVPERVGNYLRFEATLLDSIQIFNMNFLRFILCELDWKGQDYKRIDTILLQQQIWQSGNINYALQKIYVPLRELCRKFEGYHHVRMYEVPQLDLEYRIKRIERTPEEIRKLIHSKHESEWTKFNTFRISSALTDEIVRLYDN